MSKSISRRHDRNTSRCLHGVVGLTNGDCCRIARAIGMSLGEYEGRDDDSRGLAFTVCGGKTVDGREEPWIARMNGWPVEDIAAEAIKRNAVKKTGRWCWELIQPNK